MANDRIISIDSLSLQIFFDGLFLLQVFYRLCLFYLLDKGALEDFQFVQTCPTFCRFFVLSCVSSRYLNIIGLLMLLQFEKLFLFLAERLDAFVENSSVKTFRASIVRHRL